MDASIAGTAPFLPRKEAVVGGWLGAVLHPESWAELAAQVVMGRLGY